MHVNNEGYIHGAYSISGELTLRVEDPTSTGRFTLMWNIGPE